MKLEVSLWTILKIIFGITITKFLWNTLECVYVYLTEKENVRYLSHAIGNDIKGEDSEEEEEENEDEHLIGFTY